MKAQIYFSEAISPFHPKIALVILLTVFHAKSGICLNEQTVDDLMQPCTQSL